MLLKDRNIIITGASLGFGTAIAEEFVREGASLLLCARNFDPLETLAIRLNKISRDGQIVVAKTCDVSKEDDVYQLISEALKIFPHIDGLVNNAGVYGPLGPIQSLNWEEWKEAIQINLFGTVFPSRLILPHFLNRHSGKIVNLSGGGATNPLPRISAYAASKAAVVRFTETLAEEVKGCGIDINAIAPGVLDTRLTQQILKAGPDIVGNKLFNRISSLSVKSEESIHKGAKLCAYLCSSESDGISGKLIAALWDPWPKLHDFKKILNDTDIYTLRRIIPKDRGQDWGE